MNNSKDFIKVYNRLLDQLSEVNSTRLFWATDFASKNRFSCPLPDILEQLVSQGSSAKEIKNVRLKRLAGGFYHSVKLLFRMMKAREFLKHINPDKDYTVIKTFVYNHSFDSKGDYKDVFWGQLPEALRIKEPIMILATVLGDYDLCLEKMKQCKNQMVVPQEAFLSPADILQALWEYLTASIKIPASLDFMGHEVSSILKIYFHHTFNGVQMPQMIQFWTIRNLIKKVRTNKFYMTYENYPWERMTLMALRQTDWKGKIIGYQHTVVPEAFLNYFVSHSEIKNHLLPDHILTTGERPKEIMRRFSSQPIAVDAACALRFEYLHQLPLSPRSKVHHVLLALEGSLIIEPMVQVVFKQLAGNERYRLRIRTHPLLPWSVLEQRLGLKASDFSNVEISKEPLKADLEWANAVVYYSTTVSMEALMMGKPVVHVDMKSILSFDPLFECEDLKFSIPCQGSLTDAFEAIDSLTNEEFTLRQQRARKYLESYFGAVHSENLASFLA